MSAISKAPGHRRVGVALGLLVVCCPSAFALDPSLETSQYAHTAWRIREGFSKGNINAIAQTPDGYLWLATELGVLLRFDGVRTVPWQPPAPKHLGPIRTTSDGALWIGGEGGLVRWKNGVVTQYREFEGLRVSAISEDREGTVWVGTSWEPGGRVCSVGGAKVQCYGADGSLGRYVLSICEGGDMLWVYAESGLWQWKPVPARMSKVRKPEGWHLSHMACVNDRANSLIAIPEGIKQVVDGRILPNPLSSLAELSDVTSMLRDRDGGLWIGTVSRGLVHVHEGRTDRFTHSDGLSGDHVIALLEGREGSLWVLTRDGLDRFREFAIPTISVSQGLSTSRVWSVLGARDGSVWVGSSDALHRLSNGQITVYPNGHGLGDYSGSLLEDDRGRILISTNRGLTCFSNGRFAPVNEQINGQVHSIVEDSDGRLWFSEDSEGRQTIGQLLAGGVIERIPRSRLGLKESTIILSADPVRGGLWIGAKDGLAYFKDGSVQKLYSGIDGLPRGDVNDVYVDGEGTVWAGMDGGGLVRLRDGVMSTLTTRNGLPCGHVSWVREDDDHSFWLLLQCGLARIPRAELEAWAADTKRTISATIFDGPDGVQVRWDPSYGYAPVVTRSRDGKLWFTNWNGVSVIDPRRLLRNGPPPQVHIEQLAANGKVYWQNLTGAASSNLQLPPRIRDLEVDFTALSIAAPDRVRFRYKLEGQDLDWKEVLNQRKVQYSNLAPGKYRFRVKACNSSGVWNEAADFLDFSIAPAYYQTSWFRGLCAGAFLALLWASYQLRVRQLAHQLNMRLEARVSERTRIARDLHDTLLQSFQGLLLRFQTAYALFDTHPVDAKELLGSSIDQTAQAITEGREAVQGLRASTLEQNDLARAITTLAEGIATDTTSRTAVELHVGVEGTPRTLHPIVRDEIYRIGNEALRNAFRHAEAKRIEVELRYDERELRLRIRDDGKGVDPTFLTAGGRAGHFGLHGMRERAQLIQGKLTVWTAPGSGTEIELSVPASRAYIASPSPWRSWFTGKFSGGAPRSGNEQPSQPDSDSVD